MKQYDDENRADDDRNSKMSDLTQDNDVMHQALYDIKEVWAGSDGIKALTASEAYMQHLCITMFRLASDALKKV